MGRSKPRKKGKLPPVPSARVRIRQQALSPSSQTLWAGCPWKCHVEGRDGLFSPLKMWCLGHETLVEPHSTQQLWVLPEPQTTWTLQPGCQLKHPENSWSAAIPFSWCLLASQPSCLGELSREKCLQHGQSCWQSVINQLPCANTEPAIDCLQLCQWLLPQGFQWTKNS